MKKKNKPAENNPSASSVSPYPTSAKSNVTKYAYRDIWSHLTFWTVVIAGFSADLLSKHWAITHLGNPDGPQHRSLVIIPEYLRFVTVHNPGAVGGLLAGKTSILVIVSILAFIILVWMFTTSDARQRGIHIILALVLAGLWGNLYDRLFNSGMVVDFIEVNLHFWPFNPWPVFNIADILLCIGAGLSVWVLFLQRQNS